ALDAPELQEPLLAALPAAVLRLAQGRGGGRRLRGRRRLHQAALRPQDPRRALQRAPEGPDRGVRRDRRRLDELRPARQRIAAVVPCGFECHSVTLRAQTCAPKSGLTARLVVSLDADLP